MKGQKKAARIQAAAVTEASKKQERQALLQAEAMQGQQESMIARQQAIEAAKRIQDNQDTQSVEVSKDITDTAVSEDPLTGRKRNPREAYRVRPQASSGLNI